MKPWKLTDESILGLAQQPLIHWNFTHCEQITNLALEFLAETKEEMVSLDIRFCRNITDKGLLKLVNLNRLQELKIDYVRYITSSGLVQTTQRCPHLKKLSISHCVIDNLEEVLQPLPGLIALDVRGLQTRKVSSSQHHQDSDINLVCISSTCPNLESLSLADVQLTEVIDGLLASLPKLRHLDLDECMIGVQTIQHVGELKHLTEFSMIRAPSDIVAPMMQMLMEKRDGKLTSFNMARCQKGQWGSRLKFESLPDFIRIMAPSLKYLNLDQTFDSLTREVLETINEHCNLEELSVVNNPSVDASGIRACHPNWRIST
eukprot:TRINITY_DN428_c0_g1_i2.p1 TRINITY_DN428_c0_g1~~TRINITY_DN428_c0_g1_i2.p1  ORF type:complete len:318 (+),score=48.12 TRINITY_DN428_c0_g1_i2:286-1239(+)